MNYHQNDIDHFISIFQSENSPTDRYASFDYCYHYFRKTPPKMIVQDMEKSCLVLGFYLASWGMFRGSSFLLKKSLKYFEPLIGYISTQNEEIWDIDVDNYNNQNIEIIIEIYKDVQGLIIENKHAHLTLVTKILLGVFGFIPAFDNYFGKTFRKVFENECGFRSMNAKSLACISSFYVHNKSDIDKYSKEILVTDFNTGRESDFNYPKSKVIDMYGFSKGLKLKY